MARLPQHGALLFVESPVNAFGPFARDDLGRARELLGDAGFGAVELDEEGGGFGQRKLRIRIAGAYLHLVEDSMRDSGAPDWLSSITDCTAPRRSGKEITPLPTASGRPYRRKVASVMMPSVPSAPVKARTRS